MNDSLISDNVFGTQAQLAAAINLAHGIRPATPLATPSTPRIGNMSSDELGHAINRSFVAMTSPSPPHATLTMEQLEGVVHGVLTITSRPTTPMAIADENVQPWEESMQVDDTYTPQFITNDDVMVDDEPEHDTREAEPVFSQDTRHSQETGPSAIDEEEEASPLGEQQAVENAPHAGDTGGNANEQPLPPSSPLSPLTEPDSASDSRESSPIHDGHELRSHSVPRPTAETTPLQNNHQDGPVTTSPDPNMQRSQTLGRTAKSDRTTSRSQSSRGNGGQVGHSSPNKVSTRSRDSMPKKPVGVPVSYPKGTMPSSVDVRSKKRPDKASNRLEGELAGEVVNLTGMLEMPAEEVSKHVHATKRHLTCFR